MDYVVLAGELLNALHSLRKSSMQRHLDEATQGEAFVLQIIARHEDHVLPGDIRNEMCVSSARIAQALNSIEKKGWITRRIDTNDRRRIIIHMTEEGKRAAEEHHRAILALASGMLSRLGEHDAREYIRITGRLAGIIDSGA